MIERHTRRDHNVDIFCWFFGMPNEVVAVLGTQAGAVMEALDRAGDDPVSLATVYNTLKCFTAAGTASTGTQPGGISREYSYSILV